VFTILGVYYSWHRQQAVRALKVVQQPELAAGGTRLVVTGRGIW